jgi:crotonobetainyl-CoA:carnitine CoA-transferase CaiB-like acyl-CoA transferase
VTEVLKGIRVLDFGRYIAGPFCAALLADFGAEVIRIDKLGGSEDRWTGPVGADGTGAAYMQMNRNKLCITLDPLKPQGGDIVRRLVETADVVVANVPLGQLKQMRLDYETLSAINPRIIVFMNSAFGSIGPFAERGGFETIAQAMSGSMHLTGDGTSPMRVAVPVNDFSTATLGALGVVAALFERERSGKGQLVETALLHTALNFSDAILIEQELLAANRSAQKNRSWGSGPSDCFKTKDGWIFLMVIGPSQFRRWARLVGNEETWLKDPRFRDDQTRGDHGDILSEAMQAWCAQYTNEEALALLDRARIPAGPIYTPQQALDCAHINAAEFLQRVDYPGMPKAAPLVQTPVKLSRTPATIRNRAPVLGEHTDTILASLGYNGAEVEELRRNKVI